VNKQTIVTDVRLAAVLSYMRYQFRVAKDPTGMQFLFSDPGDIGEAIEAYERGDQAASAKDLLLMYDTFLEEVQAKSNTEEGVIVRATPRIPDGREWDITNVYRAGFALYAGYELLRTELRGDKAAFFFGRDGNLGELMDKFRRGQLLVEPQAFIDAIFKLRDAVSEEKGYAAEHPQPKRIEHMQRWVDRTKRKYERPAPEKTS